METGIVDEIIQRALDLLDVFAMEDDVILYPGEHEDVSETIIDVAPKAVEAAKDLGLSKDVIASVIFAVAMHRHFHISYVALDSENGLDKVIEVMKRLGYKLVEDECVYKLVEATLKAGWDTAENVAIANNYSYIVIDSPNRLLVFE